MCLVVVAMVMSSVLMAMFISMAVVALMKEEGEHTQETELGVCVDSHCPLTSRPLQKQYNDRIKIYLMFGCCTYVCMVTVYYK